MAMTATHRHDNSRGKITEQHRSLYYYYLFFCIQLHVNNQVNESQMEGGDRAGTGVSRVVIHWFGGGGSVTHLIMQITQSRFTRHADCGRAMLLPRRLSAENTQADELARSL